MGTADDGRAEDVQRPVPQPDRDRILGSSAGFAAALVKGSGKAWTLSGTKTVNGVRCTVLTEGKNGLFPAETLYVRTTTGLPVMVRYAIPGGGKTTFASWGGTARVFAPSQVVAG